MKYIKEYEKMSDETLFIKTSIKYFFKNVKEIIEYVFNDSNTTVVCNTDGNHITFGYYSSNVVLPFINIDINYTYGLKNGDYRLSKFIVYYKLVFETKHHDKTKKFSDWFMSIAIKLVETYESDYYNYKYVYTIDNFKNIINDLTIDNYKFHENINKYNL